jgi:hypothetical protein
VSRLAILPRRSVVEKKRKRKRERRKKSRRDRKEMET